MRNRRIASMALVAAAGLLAHGGCESEPVTQFVAGVSTQVRVPRDLRSVRILVQRAGEVVFCEVHDVSNGLVKLPQTLGVESTVDPSLPIAITVTGFMTTPDDQVAAFQDCTLPVTVNDENSGARILRKSVQPYVAGRTIYIPMPLSYACFDADCSEGGAVDKVCIAGKCQTPEVDPSRFVDYSDALAFGNTNTCFSPSRCLADAVPVVTVDADKCIYALAGSKSAPPPPEGVGDALPFKTNGDGLNVRVWYEGGLVSEVLDLDEREGYVVPDPKKPQQFQLFSGLCHPDAVVPHRIVAISGSGICPSKTILQPICDGEELSDETGAESPRGLCTQDTLAPTPSALLVLMDKSRSMDAFFGETAFEYVMGLSLSDPVFENTSVGMRLLPADPAACDAATNDWDDPKKLDVPFAIVADARIAISEVLKKTKVLADDPPLHLDGALAAFTDVPADGAYGALPTDKPFYNRRALAIIGNRDFSAACSGIASDLPGAAAAALSNPGKPAYTYSVLLPLPSSPPPDVPPGHDPFAAANEIAAAGGTAQALDARDYEDDPAAAADALNTLITDLSSCFYDVTPAKKYARDMLLTYFDPVRQETHTVASVPESASCATGATGWEQADDSRLEICGAACTELRDVLKTRLLLAQARGETPLDVPIVASPRCLRGNQ